MSRQVSRGSAGEYHADDQAGVARLSWRVSLESNNFVTKLSGIYNENRERDTVILFIYRLNMVSGPF